jgi:hypothetical protein
MTGLLSCFYLSGRQIVFVLSSGKLLNIYLISEDSIEPLPLSAWKSVVEVMGQGVIQVRPLPVHMLRLSKILVEQRGTGVVTSVDSSQVKSFLNHWDDNSDSSIIHIRWAAAEGIVVIPGYDIPVTDTMMVCTDRLYDSSEFETGLRRWGGNQCVLTRFNLQLASNAWQEYYLHKAFVRIADASLEEYGRFTGKILVNSIARDIHISAEKMGWSVLRENDFIVDNSLFTSPDEASRAYRDLLDTIFRHMSAVIGNRLVQTIISDITGDLEKPYARVIRRYALIPEPLQAYARFVEVGND